MKTSIALIAVICVVSVYSHQMTDEQKANARKEIDACIAETKVQPEILEAIKKGEKFTPTRELDCFSACVLKKNGVMNSDGSVSIKPTDSDAKKECKKLSGKDECETGGKIMECFAKNKLIPRT